MLLHQIKRNEVISQLHTAGPALSQCPFSPVRTSLLIGFPISRQISLSPGKIVVVRLSLGWFLSLCFAATVVFLSRGFFFVHPPTLPCHPFPQNFAVLPRTSSCPPPSGPIVTRVGDKSAVNPRDKLVTVGTASLLMRSQLKGDDSSGERAGLDCFSGIPTFFSAVSFQMNTSGTHLSLDSKLRFFFVCLFV